MKSKHCFQKRRVQTRERTPKQRHFVLCDFVRSRNGTAMRSGAIQDAKSKIKMKNVCETYLDLDLLRVGEPPRLPNGDCVGSDGEPEPLLLLLLKKKKKKKLNTSIGLSTCSLISFSLFLSLSHSLSLNVPLLILCFFFFFFFFYIFGCFSTPFIL